MLVSDFAYHLPQDLIAQRPLEDRAASRLLHLNRATGALRDLRFAGLSGLLRPGDLLVLNDSRVLPARLFGRRGGARSQPVSPRNPAAKDFLRGRVEVLLTRQVDDAALEWEALVRPGRKIGVGERLFLGAQDELEAEVTARGPFGERRLRFRPVED
ncbi:MAG: S-adenosylmethionine:tRNA ribosyltransferase-isomerase, partial [Terriglobales bacterium]